MLYLPQSWLTSAQRTRGKIPAGAVFQEKWHLAHTLLRQVRAAAIAVTAEVADGEFGDRVTFRRTLHRLQLTYAVGVFSTLTVFRRTPIVSPTSSPTGQRGRPASRLTPAPDVSPIKVCELADTVPAHAWRTVS